MANDIVLDVIDGARWTEQDGSVNEISRMIIVSNIVLPAAAVPEIPALSANDAVVRVVLDLPGVPQPGDTHPTETGLIVRNRAPRTLGPLTVQLDIRYAVPGGGGFQPPPGDQFVLAITSAVEQIETQRNRLAQPDGSPAGSQITVTHNGIEQGGEITPFQAREVIRLQHAIQSADPRAITQFLTNAVNSGPFFFDVVAPPRTWLITEVAATLEDRSSTPPTYLINYELRKNVDGHDPVIVFIDPETGRPPPGLVVGQGLKQIVWYDEIDFVTFFG